MAQIFPKVLPEKATSGEKRMFEVLQRLPDDVVAYYEPSINDSHPDFVVIIPSLGVLLIEVKGWYLTNIIKANSQCVLINREDEGELEKEEDHPLVQVDTYKIALMNRLRRDPQLSQLIQHCGKYRGGFLFPFARFAVLSNITRTNLDKIPNGRGVFPASTVATKEDLARWKTLTPMQLLQVFKGYFKRLWSIQPMSANQVNIVKTVIHPEMLLSFDFQGSEKEPTVKILDDQQERLARNLGAGHRLVFGVAGSGKTILLIARAKLLARHRPHSRVLVLCYNVTLGAYLAEVLKDYPAITVMSFHAWAKSNGTKWDPEDDSNLDGSYSRCLRRKDQTGNASIASWSMKLKILKRIGFCVYLQR